MTKYKLVPCCSMMLNMFKYANLEVMEFSKPNMTIYGDPMLYCPYCGKRIEFEVKK